MAPGPFGARKGERLGLGRERAEAQQQESR
jgi:hypothetical protein